jgi:hypothetical protein
LLLIHGFFNEEVVPARVFLHPIYRKINFLKTMVKAKKRTSSLLPERDDVESVLLNKTNGIF